MHRPASRLTATLTLLLPLFASLSGSAFANDSLERRPRVLLTNDDGIDAPGLRALAAELAITADVVVVAPKEDQSGTSQAIALDGVIRLESRSENSWAVDSTPATCVLLAVDQIAGDRGFDLVVSGINSAENVGTDIHASGTVGAARMAADLGIPAVAFSLRRDLSHIKRCSSIAASFVTEILDKRPPSGSFVNVNFPKGDPKEWRTPLVTFPAARAFHIRFRPVKEPTEKGVGEFRPRIRLFEGTKPEGSDTWAIGEGHPSITPLRSPIGDDDEAHRKWTDELRKFAFVAAPLLEKDVHATKPIAQGGFPTRVHVFEDYETEIEKQWWLRGTVAKTDAGNVCRSGETLNFDRKMGDRKNKVQGVIFNPVPGPPMGERTRLSFRYRIDGSDTIKVQIYSLSRGYHRYLKISDLPQREWRSATVDMTVARRPDGSGGPLAKDERIDDIQFYVDTGTRLSIDDIVLFEAAPETERRPFPRRVIFTGWFDTGKQGKEWPGDLDIVLHEKPKTWDFARSVPQADGGAPWLRIGLRGRRVLSARTSVDFRYRVSKPGSLRIVLADSKTKREYTTHLHARESGEWAHGNVDFLDLTARGESNETRFADEIRFYVTNGEQLDIDDLLIYEPGNPRGRAPALRSRPTSFPHRIWAACDFETQTPDYAWFGPRRKDDIPGYPGNKTSMGVAARPYRDFSGLMTGINPVPGPRMGKVNQLYLRYKLHVATRATFQHFSLSTEDNNHVRLAGLSNDAWSEVTMNFTRDGRRNDGTAGVPFREGERMDDLKIFVGDAKRADSYDLLVDDVIFFSNDPSLPPEPEPFPNRVIFLAALDTGTDPKVRAKYWPGDFEIVTASGSSRAPAGSNWGVARAVPRQRGAGKWIRLQISPVRSVGAHTKLRFRYHLSGTSRMTVQIFDATVQDNRHVHLVGCKKGAWTTRYVDFVRDAKRNDGSDSTFEAGHVVDDLFFFVQPDGDNPVELYVDEVVLFDAATGPGFKIENR